MILNVSGFLAAQIGVKIKPLFLITLEENRPQTRAPSSAHSRKTHGIGLKNGGLACLLEPKIKLVHRMSQHGILFQIALGITAPQILNPF